MNKPQTFQGDLGNLPPALLPLTEQKSWLVWRWELRTTKGGKQKWTKPPYRALDPDRHAKTDDPDTWSSHDAAVMAVKGGQADGIGFVLMGSGIGAVDLDHCVNDASIEPWAENLHTEAGGAYEETTVSGGGLRFIGTANGEDLQRKFTFNRKTGAGIELYRNTNRYITISGLERGTCPALPSLDGLIDTLFSRYSGKTKQSDGFDFNDAGRQRAPDYDDLIRNGAPDGERSEAFQSVVWHLAGQGWTVEAIVDELAKHPTGIGAKYADRLFEEVTRSYDKWRTHKRQAAGCDEESAGIPWPQIQIIDGEGPRVITEAEEALLSAGDELYNYGGQAVRPVLTKLKASGKRETTAWRLIPVTSWHLMDRMSCAAQFLRYNASKKEFVPTNCPDWVAKTYLYGREHKWKLPLLSAVTNTPFLRTDGSICETPGYDPATGILFKTSDSFPPIPPNPTRAEAAAALTDLDQIISTFPFVTGADRSVVLSGFLTVLDRRSMATAPLHALTAPQAGTGKSLLMDTIAMLATGDAMPVIDQPRKDEEFEKRLNSALLAGNALIAIDNCDRPLQGSFLNVTLTQQYREVRILGGNQQPTIPMNATLFANGNNLVVASDLTRRVLLCSMDAGCERPELREFATDVLAYVRQHRSRLVVAALTVLRAWHVSGENFPLTTLGSFDDWTQRVRKPLVWLGHPDPCDTMATVREEDPDASQWRTVVSQWKQHLGTSSTFTVQEIIGRAINIVEFHTALRTVAGSKNGQLVDNARLGRWLKRVQGRIWDSASIQKTGAKDGYPYWRLMPR
jgi:hypothetical protein